MALDDDIRILGKVKLFECFSAEQLRLLAFGAERLILRAGRELFREGQAADCAYIVVSGTISLFHDDDTGRHALREVVEGNIIGEMALIVDTQRLTGAQAQTQVEVIRINRSIFHRILEEYPSVAAELHAYISRELGAFVAEVEKFSHRFDDA